MPLGQMALPLFQEIGTDDVVEADRSGAKIKVSEQREVEEPRGELLDIELIELPELLQDGERYIRILGEDRQLGESLLLFWGEPLQADLQSQGGSLGALLRILRVEIRQP